MEIQRTLRNQQDNQYKLNPLVYTLRHPLKLVLVNLDLSVDKPNFLLFQALNC